MNKVKLSYDELEIIAEKMKILSNDMNILLNDIKNQFDLIGNDYIWSGTAALNVKETFDELSTKFPEFSNSVENCSTFLINTVIPAYKSAEAMFKINNKLFKQ